MRAAWPRGTGTRAAASDLRRCRSSARSGRPSSSAVAADASARRARVRARRDRLFFRSFSSRSSRRSATPRSARISSSSIACASRAGSIDPARMGHDRGSRNARDHVNERVGVLVAGDVDQRAAPAACASSRHVGELDRGRHPLPRVEHRGEPVEPRVGHLEMPDERSRALPCAARPSRGAASCSWKRVDLPLEPKPMSAAEACEVESSYTAIGEHVGPAGSAQVSDRGVPNRL